jgi:hypothetical protein
MTKSLPEKLPYAHKLMDQAKLDETLENIEQFENVESFSR